MENGITEHWRPVGVPIQTGVVVRSGDGGMGGSNVALDEGNVTLKPREGMDSQKNTFQVHSAYSEADSAAIVYERTGIALLQAAVEGVSAALICIGATGGGKRQLMHGGGAEKDGVVARSIRGMHDLLEERRRMKEQEGDIKWDYTLNMAMVEVYREKIQDLLNANNRDLTVVEDAVHGFKIKGASCLHSQSADEAVQLYKQGLGARSSLITDYGRPEKDASIVVLLDLVQTENRRDPSGGTRKFHAISRVLLVETAGTEKLLHDPAKLSVREPSALGRSIFATRNIINALSKPGGSDNVPYQQSKLTQLCYDAFGGNCICLILAVLGQSLTEENYPAMDLLEKSSIIMNYPVPNDERLQGLLRRFRLQIRALKEAAATGGTVAAAGAAQKLKMDRADGSMEAEFERNAHKGQVIKLQMEHIQVAEEKEALFKKLSDFRGKYDKLCEAKARIQMQLIRTEEEKLRVSKALLDMQIANSTQVEAFEAEKYEMVTKLLNAENDILELELKAGKKNDVEAQLERSVEDLMAEKKKLAMEFVTLKTNFDRVNQEYNSEMSKNEHLGAELLTLVNQNKVLTTGRDEFKQDMEHMTSQLDAREKEVGQYKIDLEKAGTLLRHEQEKAQSFLAEKTQAVLEFKAAKVEFEQERLRMQRTGMETTRDRDEELQALKRRGEADNKRFTSEREKLNRKIAEVETTVARQKRALDATTLDLETKSKALDELVQAHKQLETKYRAALKGFREKLIAFLSPGGVRSEALGKSKKEALDTLLDTFKRREKDLEAESFRYRQEDHEIKSKYRSLLARHRALRGAVEDLGPSCPIQLGEMREVSLGEVVSEDERAMKHTIEEIRERLRDEENQLAQSKEDQLRSVEKYGQMVKALENDMQDLAAKNTFLQHELDAMKNVRDGAGGGGPSPEMMKQLGELQKTLLEKIEKLSEQAPAPSPAVTAAQEAAMAELRNENTKLLKKLKDKPAAAADSGGGGGGGGGADAEEFRKISSENAKLTAQLDGLNKEIERLRAQVGSGLPKSMQALGNQLKAAEKRAAEASTKQTMAEAELMHFKDFMKKSTAKFQSQIKKLKKKAKK